MSTKGFPELQQLYALMGAKDNVMLRRGEYFPHNYNAVSRSAFFSWLNRHFQLGFQAPVIERDYQVLKPAELTVWDDQHPAPKADDPAFERALLRWFHEDAQKQIAAEAATPERFRACCLAGWEIVLGSRWPQAGEVQCQELRRVDCGAWTQTFALLQNKTYHEELPAIFCSPKQGNDQTVLWLSGAGKAALFNAEGSLEPGVDKLVKAGVTVIGVDLLYQGEFLAEGKPLTQTPKVKNPREAAAYTFGYNYAVFADRVHDVLSVVGFVKNHWLASKLSVVGLAGAGPWVAAARAQCGPAIERAVIDTGGFRFGSVLDLRDPAFLPGGAKYGDLAGLLALGAPGRTWVAGETEQALALAQAQYQAANAEKNLVRLAGAPDALGSAAVDCLLGDAK
jgi:hypothetical protein